MKRRPGRPPCTGAGLVILSFLVILPSLAFAEELLGIKGYPGETSTSLAVQPYDEGDLPGRQIGPGRVVPDIELKLMSIDNLTHEKSGGISTFATIVSPHAAYIISDATKKFIIDYLINAGYYENSTTDNYFNQRARLGYSYNPTSRIFSEVNFEYKDSRDPRGTGRAEASTGVTQKSLDEWHQWGVSGRFAYGREDAIGRIELEGGYADKNYDTNRKFTANRDRSELFGLARFHYRFMPKTRLLFEGRIRDNSYDNLVFGLPSLDSTDTQFLLGATWQRTYKTTGFFKVGYIQKNFDSDLRDDDSGLTWQSGIDWKPKTYSTVHLETTKTFNETNGDGDSIDASYYLLNWKHAWKTRFTTNINLAYQNQTFNNDPRDDDYYQAGISANYDFRRWLSISAGYRYLNLNSTDDTFDYDQNIFEITADFTF